MRFAAAITCLTRRGAEAGAMRRPFTSAPFAGGGGGGTKVAPPEVGRALRQRAGREDEQARDGKRGDEQLFAEGGRHSLSNAYGVS